MFDATNVSRGFQHRQRSRTHAPQAMPGVVIWTDIN